MSTKMKRIILTGPYNGLRDKFYKVKKVTNSLAHEAGGSLSEDDVRSLISDPFWTVDILPK
jgi:hypothetical protein